MPNINDYIRSASTPEAAYQAYKLAKGSEPSAIEATQITGAPKFNRTQSTTTTPSFSGNSPSSNNDGIGSNLVNSLTKSFNVLNDVIKGVANVAGDIYGTQIGQEGDKGPQAIEEILKVVQEGGLNPLKLLTSGISAVTGQVFEQLKQESILRSNINSQTMLTGQLSEDIRKSMVESSISAAKYGMNIEDIANFYIQLVDNSSKFSLINTKFINSVIPVAKALNLTTQELANYVSDFETIGVGATNTIKEISEATTRSVSLGLNARKVVEDMKINIGLLNQYGFKDGVRGLERMVQTAKEFKVNMKDIEGIAEKVFNPEGAIEMSARLQVLGGAMGDFSNPMRLMYDATNNVEGLQKSLINAARTLSTYNEEQQRFEVSGANLRRSKELADTLGMSMGELNKIAITASERFQATQMLMSSALNIDEKDREFLTNLSRMENGKMSIMVPESIAQKLGVPTEIALDTLDKKVADALLQNKKDFEEMSPADMADKQLTITQSMARDMSVVAQYYRVRAAQMIGGVIEGTSVQKLQDDLRKELENKVTEIKNSPNINLKEKLIQEIQGSNFDITKPTETFSKITDILQNIFKKDQSTENKKPPVSNRNDNLNVNVFLHSGPDITQGLNRELTKNPATFKELSGQISKEIEKRSFVY
jgi:hypothetical protein